MDQIYNQMQVLQIITYTWDPNIQNIVSSHFVIKKLYSIFHFKYLEIYSSGDLLCQSCKSSLITECNFKFPFTTLEKTEVTISSFICVRQ